ncbi:MAG: hypothetical protein HFACDABA_00200 [Anaerolineales bacterium]|nr:hypothetical protein [Anaerolineales bacterium]
MPPTIIRPTAKASPASSKPVTYTRFSSKLTGSLDQISKMVEDNAKMIDSIQEVALELTTSIGALHTLTVKYAGIANAILDTLLPIVKSLPLIPKNVTAMLVNLESITQKIIDNQASTGRTISDVNTGLRTGDVAKLQAHAGQLQGLTKSLTAILPNK